MRDRIYPATTLAEARRRCLAALARSGSSIRSAGMGKIGFPEVRFRTLQGAAFASAKLRHQMLNDGVIAPHHVDGEYRITEKGRAELTRAEQEHQA